MCVCVYAASTHIHTKCEIVGKRQAQLSVANVLLTCCLCVANVLLMCC